MNRLTLAVRSVFLSLALCALCAAPHLSSARSMSAAPDFPLQNVKQKIADVESRGVEFGVYIQDLAGGEVLSYRSGTPYVLASNTKLFTTAAAILALPDDFRWRTSARVQGDALWIVGGGDAAFHIIDGYSYPDKFLDALADVLRRRGQTSFRELVADARYFDAVYQHPRWPGDQLRKRYAAPVSGLPYARGLVRMKVGRSSVYAAASDPVEPAMNFLRHGLRKRGIQVRSARKAGAQELAPPMSAEVYAQESAMSLHEAAYETNTNSDNYLAEHLLKTLGAELKGDGSFEGGASAVRETLLELGAPLENFTQMDGSGLARARNGGNRASAKEVVVLLRLMAAHPQGGSFVDSLAVSGQSGTLKNRFRDGPMHGLVAAKTGYIHGSLSLSGYLVRGKRKAALFSILANFRSANTFALRERIRQTQSAVLNAAWSYLGGSEPVLSASTEALARRFDRLRENKR